MTHSPFFPNFPTHAISLTHLPDLNLGPKTSETPETTQVWVQGSERALQLLDLLPNRGLGIVGSRHLQSRTERHVRSTVLELRGQNLVILSGLAIGVDRVAHLAALEAELPTIAVLAHGLQEIFPPENQSLARQILEADGLLFTQYPLGTSSTGTAFLERNRWIAALSQATWVAQAAYRSGALNTARHARELGRMLYATPSFPGDPALSGNEKLFNRSEAQPLRDAFDFGSTWLELGSALADLRKVSGPKRKTSVLEKVRTLTLDGLPLLAALQEVSSREKRSPESVLKDFEREMRSHSAKSM